jgi:hypothetical protein
LPLIVSPGTLVLLAFNFNFCSGVKSDLASISAIDIPPPEAGEFGGTDGDASSINSLKVFIYFQYFLVIYKKKRVVKPSVYFLKN